MLQKAKQVLVEHRRKVGVLAAGGAGMVASSASAQYTAITAGDAGLITAGIQNNLDVIVPIVLALLGITVGIVWGINMLKRQGKSA